MQCSHDCSGHGSCQKDLSVLMENVYVNGHTLDLIVTKRKHVKTIVMEMENV